MTQRQANGVILFGVVILAAVVGIYLLVNSDLGSSNNDQAGTSDDDIAQVDDTDTDASETPTDAAPEPTETPEPTPEPEPIMLTGLVTHAETGEPLSGVQIEVVDSELSTVTGEDGSYELADVPPGAILRFSREDFRTIEEPVDDRAEIEIALQEAVLAGTVLDASGAPIFEATVASGESLTFTAEDGSFRIDDLPEEGDIIFKAPGYHAQVIPIGEFTGDVQMEDKPVRGVYVTAGTTANEERFNEILDMIDRTELNAVVLDIKDSAGIVFHNTSVEMAHEIDAVRPTYNMEETLRKVNERGIYAIARIVIFEDPVLAQARPELAIQDTREGGVWRTFTGLPWANPYREEVWDYNIQLMREAADLGFDEIQLDYMRFPTDGPLNRAGYGVEVHDAESRDRAIATFLERSYEAIAPTRAYLTGDIFGMTLWDPTEGEIGQNLVTVTQRLDYVHPMIYPSHFYTGAMGFDVPNDHPYEVILRSLENGMTFLDEHLRPKVRPWLQDFSYGVGISYGPNEVRAQIDAANDFGASGWLLWNAASRYHEEALEPAN